MTYESCNHECAVHKPYSRKVVALAPLPQKPGGDLSSTTSAILKKMLQGVEQFREGLAKDKKTST